MDDKLAAAAQAVHAEFLPAEHAADIATARTARLLATFLEQRATAGLAMGTGTVMVRKLAKSLTAQVEAREEFVMAHRLAAELPGQIGLDPVMFGDMSECPPDQKRAYHDAGENVVAIRAA